MAGNRYINAQTTWTGPVTTFTKANFADWTLKENQDSIAGNVKITRADTAGIFNIASEEKYTKKSSPADTEWAFGTTAEIGSLAFQNWQDAVSSNPPDMVDKDMVLHLISDDIYIDIKFTAWTKGRDGGGFSYERSTNNTTNNTDIAANKKIKLFPNPAKDYLQISGLTTTIYYSIHNILGKRIMEGSIANNQKIDVVNFSSGMYFLRLENGSTLKLIRE